jgi:cell wall-associated NlpC family hydrolase
MAEARDPRLTPARPDVAAESLRGVVRAARYAAPRPMRVAVPVAPLTATPDSEAPMTSQLLLGERFDVYDAQPGWLWGQSGADGYVGYAPDACFMPEAAPPTHRVRALQALIYPEPDVRARPVASAPLGALLAAEDTVERGFLALAPGGYAPAMHLAPCDTAEPNWVTVAARLLGAPYLWGGRTAAGIDCSGLIQIARQAAGFACPRDSDMQAAHPGRDIGEGAPLRRGDLIFWRGHVGVMLGATRLLHANGYHMETVAEPLQTAEARISASGGGPVTARRRWMA